jgi:hypothetical protein
MKVNWIKLTNHQWANFKTQSLEQICDMKGVYIIWTMDDGVIRVGSGNIKQRIEEHRKNKDIYQYDNLKFTFTIIKSEDIMHGIEAYLGKIKFEPIVGKNYPDVDPIVVNVPAEIEGFSKN